MTKTLVVYYSFTGITRPVAEELARTLDADLAEIRDHHPRRGFFWGRLRTKWQALLGLGAAIDYGGPDPATYERVLIGTPVWAGRLAAPVRSFLRRYGHACQSPGLFFTYVSHGNPAAMAAAARPLLAVDPSPVLGLANGEIKTGAYREGLRVFAQPLQPARERR